MQEGVETAGEQCDRRRGRAEGLAAIAAVTALRFLVGVGRSCLPRRGCVGPAEASWRYVRGVSGHHAERVPLSSVRFNSK